MAKYRVVGQGEKWIVVQGDVRDYLEGSLWLRQYYGEYIHLLFSDWPYNLESITRRFGKNGSAPARFGQDGAFQRQSRGFMGARWDQPLAYRAETWEMVMPHLHPGAFTASFTHPRKQHLLATAQEEAGYILNPALYLNGQVYTIPSQLGWIFSSGKPNGTRIDTRVDRRAGLEQPIVGPGKHHSPGRIRTMGVNVPYGPSEAGKVGDGRCNPTPITDLAQAWAGHRYGSPLAPELEPIIIAQKPWGPNRLDDILETGAGAINIDFGREGMPGNGYPGHLILSHHPGCVYRGEKQVKNGSGDVTGQEPSVPGRNVYNGGWKRGIPYQAKGNDDGMLSIPDYDCHPDCPVRHLNESTGREVGHHFYQADWVYDIFERFADSPLVFYSGKVGTSERNAGCGDLPLQERRRVNSGGLEHEPRFAPTQQNNPHPTLKPLDMLRRVAGLFLPPDRYAPRQALALCCGTGSEMIGCLLAGWDYVVGVELQEDYAQIACRRLAWWEERLRWGQVDPRKALANKPKEQTNPNVVQGSLFLPNDFA